MGDGNTTKSHKTTYLRAKIECRGGWGVAGTPGEVTLKLRALLDEYLASANDPQRILTPSWVSMPRPLTHCVGKLTRAFIHTCSSWLVVQSGES